MIYFYPFHQSVIFYKVTCYAPGYNVGDVEASHEGHGNLIGKSDEKK
jgi:hypothetical protein